MQKTIIPQKENGLVKGSSSGTISLNINEQLISLLKELVTAREPQVFVKVPTRRGFEMFRIDDIIRIETHSSYAKGKGLTVRNGDGNSTHIFTKWGGHFRMARKICDWKEILKTDGNFMQTHQSHLVNLLHIRRVFDEDGMQVEMVNGDTVPVSGNHKAEVIERLRGGSYGYPDNLGEEG